MNILIVGVNSNSDIMENVEISTMHLDRGEVQRLELMRGSDAERHRRTEQKVTTFNENNFDFF